MRRRQVWILAIPAIVLCVGATQFAMRGRHEPTQNTGFLGSEIAGVEGEGGTSSTYGVLGTHIPSGNTGRLGTASSGLFGSGTTGLFAYGTARGISATAYGAGSPGIEAYGGPGGLGVSGSVDASGTGVSGYSGSGYGVMGFAGINGTGVYGVITPGGTGYAGRFNGPVEINGALSKSAGSFKIDHPLDPANKYLFHSFVESPDMKNIYDGVAILDRDGTAVVELPKWFEALNRDFRYQLTCIGEHAPVYIAEEVHANQFRIAGGYRDMKVSWQVTGTRQDAYAKAHPIPVEETKPPGEAGRYLHPELFGQPPAMQITPAPAPFVRVGAPVRPR